MLGDSALLYILWSLLIFLFQQTVGLAGLSCQVPFQLWCQIGFSGLVSPVQHCTLWFTEAPFQSCGRLLPLSLTLPTAGPMSGARISEGEKPRRVTTSTSLGTSSFSQSTRLPSLSSPTSEGPFATDLLSPLQDCRGPGATGGTKETVENFPHSLSIRSLLSCLSFFFFLKMVLLKVYLCLHLAPSSDSMLLQARLGKTRNLLLTWWHSETWSSSAVCLLPLTTRLQIAIPSTLSSFCSCTAERQSGKCIYSILLGARTQTCAIKF